jgi:uncharacterized metal-binding protein
MSPVNAVMCAGYSPTAQVVRKALRRVAEVADIRVIIPCPVGGGVARGIDELKALEPGRSLVVEGCDGCCAMQVLMTQGMMPARTVIVEKTAVADERSVAIAEAQILEALKELGP